MAYISYDDLLGAVDLSITDTQGFGPTNLVAGTGSGRAGAYFSELRGYDPNLGGGTFVYVKGGGTVNAGDWVELSPSLTSGVLTTTAIQWAGTANSGKPLGVAVSALTTSTYGWVQVQGAAICNITGTVAAGDPVYFSAAGSTKTAATASKQVLNAVAATANNATVGSAALGSTKAVIYIDRPCVQSAIT